MHWKELRGFFFPIFMEEINKVKTKYLNLIQQIQKTNQEKDRKTYIELRKSIEKNTFTNLYTLLRTKNKIKNKKSKVPEDFLN